jgi:hypothetical protein
LLQSGTAKQAESIADNITTSAKRTFATSLETTGAAGLCLCMIHVGRENHGVSAETKPDAGADWTLVGTTTWTYIDAAVWTFTIWTNTGVVQLGWDAYVTNSVNGTNGQLDFTVDGVTVQEGTAIGAAGTPGSFSAGGSSNDESGVVTVKGLSVGSHTFRVAWHCAGGSTLTLLKGSTLLAKRPNFWVKELDS